MKYKIYSYIFIHTIYLKQWLNTKGLLKRLPVAFYDTDIIVLASAAFTRLAYFPNNLDFKLSHKSQRKAITQLIAIPFPIL